MQYVWMLEVLEDLRRFAQKHDLNRVDDKLKEVVETVLDEVPFKTLTEVKKLFDYQASTVFDSSWDSLPASCALDEPLVFPVVKSVCEVDRPEAP